MYDFRQYTLNIPKIDSEHLEVLELLDQLSDTSLSVAEKSMLRMRVIALSAGHLSLESKMMVESKYPVEEDHTAEHLIILHQVMDLPDGYTREDVDQILRYFLHHIDTFDRAFSIFLLQNRSRRKSEQKQQEQEQERQQLSLWPGLPEEV